MPRFEEPAVEYIKRMYEPDDRLAIVKIQRPSGAVRQEIRTAREIVEPGYQARLRYDNARDACIYVTANALREGATGRTKNDIETVRHVYLDVDTKGREVLDKVLHAPDMPKPHAVLETSPSKFQVMYQVDGFTKEKAEEVTRGMAHHFGADAAVFDSARVMRLPGFRHCKDLEAKPHYVRDILPESQRADKVHGPGDFPKYEIERQRQFSEARTHMAVQPVRGGSQSERDWAYAMRHLERGVDPGTIERSIANYRQGDKYDSEKYAHLTVEKAQAKLASQPDRGYQGAVREDRSDMHDYLKAEAKREMRGENEPSMWQVEKWEREQAQAKQPSRQIEPDRAWRER
jgi:hypothetical protein